MRFGLLIALSLNAFGCGKKPGAYKIDNSQKVGDSSNLNSEAEANWVNRGDKAALEKALAQYETLHVQTPNDRDVLAKLVRGWYFMGDAHETEKSAKMIAWDKAFAFGEKCLSLNDAYKGALEKSGNKAEAIAAATKEDVPCIYWSASSLGKWAKINGIVKSIQHKPTLFAFISKVEELDASYFYGAANRYWGAYYSVIPSFAGRDLEKSKENFDASIKIAPGYLGTYNLYAENWATKSQNVAEFDEAIQYVMASDPNALPADLLPENIVEVRKAKEFWQKRDSFFNNPAAPQPLKNAPPKVEATPEVAPETTPENDTPVNEGSQPEAAPEPAGSPTEKAD